MSECKCWIGEVCPEYAVIKIGSAGSWSDKHDGFLSDFIEDEKIASDIRGKHDVTLSDKPCDKPKVQDGDTQKEDTQIFVHICVSVYKFFRVITACLCYDENMIHQLRQMIRMSLQTTGNILSKLYAQFLLMTVVRRDDSAPTHVQKIFVANHPNTLDPFYLLGILQERVVILITTHVFHIPVLGRLVRRAGHIEVTNVGSDVYTKAKEALLQGKSLLIFAEGEISHSPYRLRKFRTGAVRLSMETGVPVVPIGIHVDASKIWKKQTEINHKPLIFTWYRYGWYTVKFGKPVLFSGVVSNRALVRAATVSLRRQVIASIWQARQAGAEDAISHKRIAKRGFHLALRGVYKFVCFVAFIFFKLNALGIKILG